MEHAHHGVHPVHHGDIDHGTLARAARLQESGEQPGHEKHRAAAVIPDEVERGHGRLPRAAHGAERARDGDIIDVVARRPGPWSRLSPARHATVDEGGVAGVGCVRTDAEPLHHAGAQSLDQRIRARGEIEQGLHALGLAQVQDDGVLAAIVDRGHRHAGPVHEDHLGPHIREQHPGIGTRPDTCELDDAGAGKGKRHRGALAPFAGRGRKRRARSGRPWCQLAYVLRSVSSHATSGDIIHVSACRRSWTQPPSATGS